MKACEPQVNYATTGVADRIAEASERGGRGGPFNGPSPSENWRTAQTVEAAVGVRRRLDRRSDSGVADGVQRLCEREPPDPGRRSQ